MPHWRASHHSKSNQAISFHFTWYIIIHIRKGNLGYKHYFYVSVFKWDNPVCYLHGMKFRKLFPTNFLLRDLCITYVWWYVTFSAVILYSRITVQAVMMKRKAAIAQESYCGVFERHKSGCVDECSKPAALTRQCECDENAQLWQFRCWQQHIFHLGLSMCRRYSFSFKRSVANCFSTLLANRVFSCTIIVRYNNKILFMP